MAGREAATFLLKRFDSSPRLYLDISCSETVMGMDEPEYEDGQLRQAERKAEDLAEENGRLTAWLAWSLDVIDDWVAGVKFPNGLDEWRQKGKEQAEARRKAIRARGLAKLTPEEREALGIS